MIRCSYCNFECPDDAFRCPRCGAKLKNRRPASGEKSRRGVAGFVLSLIGLVTLLTTPLQIGALILSISALRGNPRKGLAVSGILISLFSLLLSLLLWAVLFADLPSVLEQIREAIQLYY